MNMTSTQTVRAHACPDFICLQAANRKFTAREWEALTAKTAAWLLTGRRPGAVVAVLGENRWEVLALFWACVRTGFVFMPLDPRMTEAEMAERLALAEPDLTVQTAELDGLEETVRHMQPSAYCHQDETAWFYAGFTSGSSGTPKQFVRSQQSWVRSFEAGLLDFPVTGRETAVIAGPIHHSLFLYGAAFAFYTGQKVMLAEKFLPARVTGLLSGLDSFVLYAVPTMLEALSAVPGRGIVFLSGAGWPAERKKSWAQQNKEIRLYEFYGASELSFVSYMTPEDIQAKPESSGKPSTGVSIEVRSGSRLCGPFEAGTIYVKSPMLFSGYLEGRKCRLDLPEDGFYTVGDAGYTDEAGYLYVIGREQFMIISGGVNVYPEEVERAVKKCPHTGDVAVTSVRDKRFGERIICLYTGTADEQAIRFFVKSALSVEKRPRRYIRVRALPVTSNGKVNRAAVKKEMEERTWKFT